MTRKLFFFIAMSIYLMVPLKADQLRRILRLLERSEVEKAVETLTEGLEEEENHPGYLWIAAELASTDTLSFYDLDSAYSLVKKALPAFDSASADQLKDFEKVPFDKSMIQQTERKVQRLWWAQTQQELTASALAYFMQLYPGSRESQKAKYQVDSLGFVEAETKGTWQAYLAYQNGYSTSEFIPLAKDRYEELLYKDKTFPESEEVLEAFLRAYNDSPYRSNAVERLLPYKLRWNQVDTLLAFARNYPEMPKVQKALDYAFHLNPKVMDDAVFLANYLAIDSLRQLKELNRKAVFLLPDAEGIRTIDLKDQKMTRLPLSDVQGDAVHCRVYDEDYFFEQVDGQGILYLRSGQQILTGNYLGAKEVGLGTILLNREEGSADLVHKTGDKILIELEEAEVFSNRWLKVRRNGSWALAALNGELLCDFIYDDIRERGTFWIFEKEGLYAVSNQQMIDQELGAGGFTLLFKYDDYEVVDEEWIIGFKGSMEGLINQELSFIIPWGEHVIFPNKRVPYAKREGRYTIYPQQMDIPQGTYDEVVVNDVWIALKDSSWSYRKLLLSSPLKQADSVLMIGEKDLFTRDSLSAQLRLAKDSTLRVDEDSRILILSATANLSGAEEYYFLLSQDGEKKLIGADGQVILALEEDDLPKPIGDSLFIMPDQRGRLGVMQNDGEWLLSPGFSFINREGDMLNLVAGNEIGAYRLTDSLFFEPAYASNITAFGPYFSTRTENGMGLLDAEQEEVIAFVHEDLSYYSDSLVWVKTDSSWQVQQIKDDLVVQYGVRSFEELSLPVGKAFKVTTSRGYGVLDDKGRYIIQPSFSDIRLIAHATGHLYVAEKSVPEADFYIWVGFDPEGNKIFSEAYRTSFYDQIACD